MADTAKECSPEAKAGVGLARDEIQAALRGGEAIECPCCDRTVQKTKRSINPVMIEALRFMRDRGTCFTKDMPEAVQKNRDFPRLAYWGLAEKIDTAGAGRGAWRITQDGRSFLAGDLKVPKNVFVFADEVLSRTETDLVSVHDCTDVPDHVHIPKRKIGGMSDNWPGGVGV